jgi:hypothetical protein
VHVADEQVWVTAGVEVAADRRKTWVALAGADGRLAVVDLQPALAGTLVTAQLISMWERLGLEWFGLDPSSPSSTLVAPLTEESMPLKLASAADVATAHGTFIDMLNAGRLRLTGDTALDEAGRAAEARRLAGGEAVQRYADTDMAPLLAAELAVWALGDPEAAGGIEPGAWAI